MKRISLLFVLLYSCSSLAAIDMNKIRALFESGNSKAAYELTVNEARTYEGDPNFDYYYGISAIDTGHASEGVFALERVLLIQPDNHAARLELARGYFILEEYSRARAEFRTVLEAEPPSDVSDKIYAYLDVIRLQESRYTTVTTAYVELGTGSDSNANSGPSNPEVTAIGISGQLSSSSLEQSDSFSEFTANYGISIPITAGTSFSASINGNLHSNSDLSEYDTATYTGSTGFRFLHAQDAYLIDLTAQQFDVDGDEYRQLVGFNTNWRRRLSQQSTSQVFLQYAQQDFIGQETRNVATTTLGAGFSKRFNVVLSPVLFTSLYIAQDDPELDTDTAKSISERDYYGARIGTIISVTSKSSIQLSLSFQNSEYGLEDLSALVVREDNYVNTDLDFKWLLSRNWSLRANANLIQNDSNVTLNEYDRTQFSLNLRYEMK